MLTLTILKSDWGSWLIKQKTSAYKALYLVGGKFLLWLVGCLGFEPRLAIKVKIQALRWGLHAWGWECGPCPVFASNYALAFTLQLRKITVKACTGIALPLNILSILISSEKTQVMLGILSSFLSQCEIQGWSAVSCEPIYFALRALRLTFNSFLTEVWGSCNDIEFIRIQNPISLLQIGDCSCIIWLWLSSRITLKCEREIMQWISSVLLEYILSTYRGISVDEILTAAEGGVYPRDIWWWCSKWCNGLCKTLGHLMKWKLLKVLYYHYNYYERYEIGYCDAFI